MRYCVIPGAESTTFLDLDRTRYSAVVRRGPSWRTRYGMALVVHLEQRTRAPPPKAPRPALGAPKLKAPQQKSHLYLCVVYLDVYIL